MALRNLDRRNRREGRQGGEVIATPGEILAEDEESDFERDSATDDTRAHTAISWLEEASLLSREDNRVQVFPSWLRVRSIDEARGKLAGRAETGNYERQLLAIVDALIAADADEGIPAGELMGISGLSAAQLRRAFADLERLGLAANGADRPCPCRREAPVARPARNRRETGGRTDQGAGGIPAGHDHTPRWRLEEAVQATGLRAAQAALRRAAHPDPRHGRIRPAWPREDGRRASAGDGLFQPEAG